MFQHFLQGHMYLNWTWFSSVKLQF